MTDLFTPDPRNQGKPPIPSLVQEDWSKTLRPAAMNEQDAGGSKIELPSIKKIVKNKASKVSRKDVLMAFDHEGSDLSPLEIWEEIEHFINKEDSDEDADTS